MVTGTCISTVRYQVHVLYFIFFLKTQKTLSCLGKMFIKLCHIW